MQIIILVFNLELFPRTTKDLDSTGDLVPGISNDPNCCVIHGLTLGPDHDLTNMLYDPSFVDHSLSLIISSLVSPQTLFSSTLNFLPLFA
jgi:hypothetical protein